MSTGADVHGDAELAAAFAELRAAVLSGCPGDEDAQTFHRLTARRVLEDPHAGPGALTHAFAATLRALGPVDALDEIGRACLVSQAFQCCGGRAQPCVEEAFGRFALERGVAPATALVEMLRAVLMVRAVTPRPLFSLPREIMRVGTALAARVDDTVIVLLDVDGAQMRLASGALPSALAKAIVGEAAATPAQAAALRARGFPVPAGDPPAVGGPLPHERVADDR